MNRPETNDYLVLTGLGLAWGFIIWVIPSLISEISGHTVQTSTASYKVLSVLKWFAFPVSILHTYFLLLFLSRILQVAVRKSVTIIYFSGSAILSVWLLIRILQELPGLFSVNFGTLAIGISYLYIFLEIGIFLFFFLIAFRQRQKIGALPVLFILTSLSIYLVYLLVSSAYSPLPTVGGFHGTVLNTMSFFAVWCGPMPIILRYFRRQNRPVYKRAVSEQELRTILAPFRLTAREQEMAVFIYSGAGNQEIEDTLFLSRQTIKNYISTLFRKLGVKNRLELIRFIRSRIDYL